MPAVKSVVHINRTPYDVFAFVSDYEHDPQMAIRSLRNDLPEPRTHGRRATGTGKIQGIWAAVGNAHRGNGVRAGHENCLAVDFWSNAGRLVPLGRA